MLTVEPTEALYSDRRNTRLKDGYAITNADGVGFIGYDHGVIMRPKRVRGIIDSLTAPVSGAIAAAAGLVLYRSTGQLEITPDTALVDAAMETTRYIAGAGLVALGAVMLAVSVVCAVAGHPFLLSESTGFKRFGKTRFIESEKDSESLTETLAVLSAAGRGDITKQSMFINLMEEPKTVDVTDFDVFLFGDEILDEPGVRLVSDAEFESDLAAIAVAESRQETAGVEDADLRPRGGSTRWYGQVSDASEWFSTSPFDSLGDSRPKTESAPNPNPNPKRNAPETLIGNRALAGLDLAFGPMWFRPDTTEVEALNLESVSSMFSPATGTDIIRYTGAPMSMGLAYVVLVSAAARVRFIVSEDGEVFEVFFREPSRKARRNPDTGYRNEVRRGRSSDMLALSPAPEKAGRHRGWWF